MTLTSEITIFTLSQLLTYKNADTLKDGLLIVYSDKKDYLFNQTKLYVTH